MSRTATYSDDFLLRLVLRVMSDVARKPIVLSPADSLVTGFVIPYSGWDEDPWDDLTCTLGYKLDVPAPFDEWSMELFPPRGALSKDEFAAACRKVTVGDLI